MVSKTEKNGVAGGGNVGTWIALPILIPYIFQFCDT